MVETYSSYCGTAAAAMVSVCTGNACGAAAAGGACFAQAESTKRISGRDDLVQTASLVKAWNLSGKDYWLQTNAYGGKPPCFYSLGSQGSCFFRSGRWMRWAR